MLDSPSASRIERLPFALTGLVLILTPFLMGGRDPAVNLLVALAMLTALAVHVWRGGKVDVGVVAVALLVVVVWALLQLLPLPTALIQVLSPGTNNFWTNALGSDLRWATASLAPTSTAHEVLKLAVLVSGALLAAPLFLDEKGPRRLLALIAVSGATMAGWALLYDRLGLRLPVAPFGRGGIMSPSELAGFLGFATFIGISAGLSVTGRLRWFFCLAASVPGLCLVVLLPLEGMLMFALAAVFLLVLLVIDKAGLLARPALPPVLVFVTLGVLALSIVVRDEIAAPSRIGARQAATAQQTDNWSVVPGILGEFRLLGAGHGAAATVLPHYLATGRPTEVRTNVWLSWAIGVGSPIALLVLALLVLGLLRALRLCAGAPDRQAAIAGVVFIAGHNLADPSLELTGVALPAVVVFAVLARGASGLPLGGSLTPRRARLLTLGFAGVVAAVAWPAVGWEVKRDKANLQAVLREIPGPEARAAQVRDVLRRHPTSVGIMLAAARRELREFDGDERALPYLGRALFLSPSHVLAQRLAGQTLLQVEDTERAMRSQAASLAAKPRRASRLSRASERKAFDLPAMKELAGDTPQSREAVAQLLLVNRQPAEALELLEQVTVLDRPKTWELRARAFYQLDDLERALEAAAQAERLSPFELTHYELQAILLSRAQRFEEALAVLERGLLVAGRAQSLLELAGDRRVELDRVDKLRAISAEAEDEELIVALRAAAAALQAKLSATSGDLARAEELYRNAMELQPRKERYAIALAELLGESRRLEEARNVLNETRGRAGLSPRLRKALQRLKEREKAAAPAKEE